jgi:crotonobetainyl-CoA:carnitine CoA-transferase CaiB-like acyl-CoA transferase
MLEKMGLGPEALHERNPGLVVVRISGWGQTGRFRAKPGFGSLVEAFSGFAAMNGFADRPPVLPAFAMADAFAGLYGALAALTALRVAERGGRGQVIDLALLEPILAMLGPKAAEHRLTGETTPRMGSRCTIQAPRDVYRTRDGRYLALSTGTQAMAERLFRAIGRPELLDDPRFRTNADRLRNRDAVESIVAAFIAERTQAEALAFFGRAEVTVGPVCDEADLAADPYVAEREVLIELPDAQARPPADAQRRAAAIGHPRRAPSSRPQPRRTHRRDPPRARLPGRRDRAADRGRGRGRKSRSDRLGPETRHRAAARGASGRSRFGNQEPIIPWAHRTRRSALDRPRVPG